MFDLSFDLSIRRMLEYAAMSIRAGVAGLVCALAVVGAGCSAKAPLDASRPVAAAGPVAPAWIGDQAAVSTPAAADPSPRTLTPPPDSSRQAPPLAVGLPEPASAAERGAQAQVQDEDADDQRNEPAPIDQLLAISTMQPAPTVETTEAVTKDLRVTVHDIDIPLNPRVLSFVQLFSGRLKDYLEDGLNRGAAYLPMIQEIFREEGLPLDLAYVPLIESAFKPNAVSRAKAKGMWQFMRGTALENGLEHDWYIDERADPEKATRAAAKYLKTLYGMFGDWHLALASYNGGPGRVQRAMRQSGRKDFWALTSTRRYLPRETRDYVPLVLAAVIVARNPSQYGISVQPPDPQPVERLLLASAVDLRRIAEWTGTPMETIQALNPELRRWTTPLRASEYEIAVPEGTADFLKERLTLADPADLSPVDRHTVKKGDTLLSIAKKLKVTRADLAEANYLKTTAKLSVGQQLIIPRAPKLPVHGDGVLLARADAGTGSDEQSRGAAGKATAGQTAAERTYHRVKAGETLFSIARLYRTSVALLQEWNGLTGSSIRAGQRLTVHAPDVVSTN
jgi:membrane-bound lytic murein transglycosylase D